MSIHESGQIAIRMVFLMILFFLGCDDQVTQDSVPGQSGEVPDIGPQTSTVDTGLYQKVWYLSGSNGSDENGNGTRNRPWKSLSAALKFIPGRNIQGPKALLVSEGNYLENNLKLSEHLDLYGGFSARDWQRDIFRYPTVLDGNERGRILIAADSCRVDGFIIRQGSLRGKGAGLLCEVVSPYISNNIFQANRTRKPEPWNPKYWHETAHDGGAIYCTGGAAPVIIQNFFIANRTENGRGAAIAADGRCQPVIAGNLFMNNVTGLDDPMRSSDGGAVSLFNWCHAVVENNVFIGNRALASNDAGALFIALWTSARVSSNIFLDSEAADDAGAVFVGGQEHRYDAPLDPIPSEKDFYVTIEKNIFMANRNSSRNSGAMRFTMESRGKFSGNLVVHNAGIYFQRSEVLIENNRILDNFLLIETKEGLKPAVVRDNLIWAGVTVQTPAVVENNNLKDPYPGSVNYTRSPIFVDDFIELKIFSGSFSRPHQHTVLYTHGIPATAGNLKNRIVKAGNHWSVIKDFDLSSVTVWGDMSGEIELTVLPSYVIVD